MGVGDKVYRNEEITVRMGEEGTEEVIVVPEGNTGDVPGLLGMRSYICVICGLAFKEKDVVLFRGKPYGRPCGCSMDVQSILKMEREDRRRNYNGSNKKRQCN